jgi:hypothetical protein
MPDSRSRRVAVSNFALHFPASARAEGIVHLRDDPLYFVGTPNRRSSLDLGRLEAAHFLIYRAERVRELSKGL